MKAVVQRVKNANVVIDGKVNGEIDLGLLIYFCVEKGDTEKQAQTFAKKINALRIFRDENGKMNLNTEQVNGKFLVISQFTLAANPLETGNRPSFDKSEERVRSEELYEFFIRELRSLGSEVETGIFGADMSVNYTNHGPVTLIYQT